MLIVTVIFHLWSTHSTLCNGAGQILTTDDGNVDLDICEEKRRVGRIIVSGACEEKPHADSGHDYYPRPRFFISKGRGFARQGEQSNSKRGLTFPPKQISQLT